MAKVKDHGNGTVSFMCPGCKLAHTLHVVADGVHPAWSYNGDTDAPTLYPSVNAVNGHYSRHHTAGSECWCDYNKQHPEDADIFCAICHSFVTDGKIQFLSDCTHALVGQTVDLPEYEQH